MAWFSPHNAGYRAAKRIKQGRDRLDPRFDDFIGRFEDAFGVRPLTIELDTISRARADLPTPSLGVILERTADQRSFIASHGLPNFDRAKQRRVAEPFVDAMSGSDLTVMFGMPRSTPASFAWRERLFVYFRDFERFAVWEVHDLVTSDERDEWSRSLGLGERLWCVERGIGPPVVFVLTASDAAELSTSAQRREWGERYLEVARRHDEFGYLEHTVIDIRVDSKENFDANYASSWFYYFR